MMIHLNVFQYPALRKFSEMVKRELSKNPEEKRISQTTWLIGQDYGFCNDEIREIIDVCQNNLKVG